MLVLKILILLNINRTPQIMNDLEINVYGCWAESDDPLTPINIINNTIKNRMIYAVREAIAAPIIP